MNEDKTITMGQFAILGVLIAVVVSAITLVFMPKSVNTVVAGSSPSGTTFNTAKVAAINFAPATSAASSTSILNTDAQPRIIIDSFVSCQGANGQGGSFQAATTSLANLGFGGNTNFVASTTATTTAASPNFYVSTSTEGQLPFTGRIWPSGAYLTFVAINSSYTGLVSETCTVGSHYLAS